MTVFTDSCIQREIIFSHSKISIDYAINVKTLSEKVPINLISWFLTNYCGSITFIDTTNFKLQINNRNYSTLPFIITSML